MTERGRKPWEPEMSERTRSGKPESPTAIQELGVWTSHSQQWSAISPNRVTVGVPTNFTHAAVAQWQSRGFVHRRFGGQVPAVAP